MDDRIRAGNKPCGPAFFNVRPHSNGRGSLFVWVVGKPFKKNGLESPLIFVLF